MNHPGRCIWYVSKYVSPPADNSSGGRGYLIMRELVRTGNRCVILTSDSNQLAQAPNFTQSVLTQEVEGMTLCWIRTMKYSVAKSMRRILSWLDFEYRLWRMPKSSLPKPDAIIVSSLSLLTILNGFWLRRKYRCRLALEIRDIWPLTITEEGGFSRWNPLVLGLGMIERLGYRYADEVVGTMPNLGEHVRNVLGYARPVHCIPMGVDEASLADAVPLPQEYIETHLPADKFIVAHAGTIGIANALDVFMECAQSLRDRPGIHFVVVGDGDLRAYYQQKYAHVPNLSFAPKVPKQQVQSVLSRCSLLYFSVHPSQVWRYGQSLNKVIDYMLSGKPVVASYTGYPSMIDEADCGCYVPAGDVKALEREILRYAAMPSEQRQAVGQRGRDWVLQHRRYPVLAARYLGILFPDPNQVTAVGEVSEGLRS